MLCIYYKKIIKRDKLSRTYAVCMLFVSVTYILYMIYNILYRPTPRLDWNQYNQRTDTHGTPTPRHTRART